MTEAKLQQLIIRWLEAALPNGSIWHHSPNEGARHIAFKRKLRLLGTQWGWPDLEIFVPPSGFVRPEEWAPIFLEVKVKRGRPTTNQREMQQQLELAACRVTVVKSITEVEDFLTPIVRLQPNGKASLIKQLEQAMA